MRYLYIFTLLFSIVATASHSQTSNDVNWDSRFCPCGVTFEPTSIVKDGEKLYIGGKRKLYDNQVQGKDINLPAVWDGKKWSSLGGGVKHNADYIFNFGDTVLVAGFLDTNSGHIYERAKFWNKKTEKWFSIPDVDADVYANVVADNNDLFMVGRLLDDTGSFTKIIRYNYKEEKWYSLPLQINKDFVISPTGYTNRYILSINKDNLFAATTFRKVNDTTKYSTVLKFDRNSNTWSILSDTSVEIFRDTTIDTIPTIPYEINSMVIGNGDTLFVTFPVNSYFADHLPIGGFWDGKKWHIWSDIIALPAIKDVRFIERTYLQIDNNKLYMTGNAFIMNNKDTISYCVLWDGQQWREAFPGLQTSYYFAFNTRIIGGTPYSYNNGANISIGGQKNLGRWNGKNWVPIDSGTCFGLDGVIRATTMNNDTLYVQGDFTRAGGVVTRGMAFWDGNSWNAMRDIYGSDDFPSGLNCMKVYKNKLYGGINNNNCYEDSTSGLLVWENNKWITIPKGDSAGYLCNIRALEVFNDTLIVVGDQYYRDDLPTDMIAKWDGMKWSKFSSTSCVDTTVIGDPYISGITTDGTSIYVAGHFTRIGSDTMNSISKWNGKEWKPIISNGIVGLGNNNKVGTIVYDSTNTRLIITAYFDDILGIAANGIAAWNGEEFTSLFKPKVLIGDMSVYGSSMVLIGSNLVLSPAYPKNPNIPIKLDSSKATSRFGTGVGVVYYDQSINSMQTDTKGNLYVLGSFNEAGKKTSANIALWMSTPTTSIHIRDVSKNISSVFPNPASGFVRFTLANVIGSIIITDVMGTEVETISTVGKSTFLIDLVNYRPGIYNALIQANNSKQITRFVVIK